jgi:hypothetical protein
MKPKAVIAVSVHDAGAVLITKNAKDFDLIHEVYDFKYIVADRLKDE